MNSKHSITSLPKYNEWIFYLFFALMFGARAAGLDEGNIVYSVIFIASMVLFLLKVAATEHTFGEYIWMGMLLLLALAVYYRTGEKGLLLCFALMLGMKGVRVKSVFQIGTLVLAFFFSLNVFLSVFGLKSELFYYQDRAGIGGDFRHALGYPHPNSLQLNCFVLVMLVMFLTGKKNKRRTVAVSCVMMGISLYIFLYSGSRTGLFITIFYLIVNCLFLYRSEFTGIEKIIVLMIYPVCAVSDVFIPFAGSQKLIGWISDHMGTIGARVNAARFYFDLVPVSLFGSRIEITKDFAYGIDMGYAYLFLVLGVAAFAVFSILYIGFIHYCLKTDQRSELAVTTSIVLMGTLEPFLFNLSFKNLSLIFLGQYLFVCSEQMQKKFSGKAAFLNRHVRLLAWGGRSIQEQSPVGTLIESCRNCRNRCFGFIYDPAMLKRSMILFLLTVALVSAGFFGTAKRPSAIYTDSDRGERMEIGLVPVYLSEQKAAELRKNGDILIHYQGSEVPMYRYDGAVAYNEYIRKMVSSALWSGVGIIIIFIVSTAIKEKNELPRGKPSSV
jgi:hypothetical protein